MTRQETIVREDVEKGDPSYIVGGNASWYSNFEKVWRSLKRLKIELPCVQPLHYWVFKPKIQT